MSKIYLGAAAFMDALRIESTRANRFYVQAMTFEGDEAGAQLIDILLASPAKDKRLLIDSFSKVVVSDHFVYSLKYLHDAHFRQEVLNTYALIKKAKAGGVKVQFTNPVGVLMNRYPLRNHKKMVILDDLAFLGGINFSDHNFGWHDMMIGIDDHAICEELAVDFLETWVGTNQSKKVDLTNSTLFFLNGRKSKNLYGEIFDELAQASEITVISPYVSGSFLDVLNAAGAKGTDVRIISTGANNKSLMQRNLMHSSRSGNFNLHIRPAMSHMKAILVDENKLIFGSSNFDIISYYFEQEVLVSSQDQELIADFKVNVFQPLLIESRLFREPYEMPFGDRMAIYMLTKFCQVASQSILKVK